MLDVGLPALLLICNAAVHNRRILYHKRETLFKVNLFQLVEWHYSWGNILFKSYQITAHVH